MSRPVGRRARAAFGGRGERARLVDERAARVSGQYASRLARRLVEANAGFVCAGEEAFRRAGCEVA